VLTVFVGHRPHRPRPLEPVHNVDVPNPALRKTLAPATRRAAVNERRGSPGSEV
jgi:hypothetical protein